MHRPLHPFHALTLLVLVFWSCWTVAAACPHLNSERGPLYERSSFAHGYIHGYELGFHLGNQDLQLARNARDISKSEEYHKATEGYREQSGPRDAFRAGYRDGLIVGYTDAKSGHSFRAIDEARIAATRLDAERVPAKAGSRNFELGFMDGYRAGTMQGVGDGRNQLTYRPGQAECGNARENASFGESYCVGYLRGFNFGYSDGYINYDELTVATKGSRAPAVTAARK